MDKVKFKKGLFSKQSSKKIIAFILYSIALLMFAAIVIFIFGGILTADRLP